MPSGRPPAWNPVPALGSLAWTELLVFSSKERATMPSAARSLLRIARGERWLADLSEPGTALLARYDDGAGLMKRLGELTIDPDMALAIMDRFQVVPMSAEGRLTLSPSLLAHLDALTSGAVRLVVKPGSVQLMSEELWISRRSERVKAVERIMDQAAAP